jgi:hypothetical protein
MNLRAPELLTTDHLVHSFACGESLLDEWLKRRALGNQTSGASKTFVVTNTTRWLLEQSPTKIQHALSDKTCLIRSL